MAYQVDIGILLLLLDMATNNLSDTATWRRCAV